MSNKKIAELTPEQIKQIKQVEKQLGVVLIAYEKRGNNA